MNTSVKPKKRAVIHANDQFIDIETHSGYGSSAVDPEGAAIHLDSAPSRELLGQSLQEALSKSRTLKVQDIDIFFDREKIQQHYEYWVAGLMQRYRYRNRKTLFAGLKSCFVVCEDGLISISPSRRDGAEGWSGIGKDERVVVAEGAPSDEIGQAVYLALARCIT